MKKTLICCGVLCMTLLLFCGAALAADAQITLTNPDAVQVEQIDKNGDIAFKITKSGVESGQLYLVMIQEGASADEKPKPTKDNLYYLNVEEAASSWEAYPKALQQGVSYVVYLSDYSDGANGAARGVATISLKSDSGDSGGGGSTTEYQRGDVNKDGVIDVKDRAYLTRFLANWNGYSVDISVGDLNEDGEVTVKDRAILTRHLANWDGYATLPYKP